MWHIREGRAVVLSLGLVCFLATSANAAEPRTAIQGYDAVGYFAEGRPMKGAAEFHHDFDGQRYHFATAQHRAKFVADPERYIPQFGANCAGSVAYRRPTQADPLHWKIVDGKLFLFRKAAVEYFAKNPEALPGALAKGRRNWESTRR